MKSCAYIAGVGMHPFGRFPQKSLPVMGQEALAAALQDAGIELRAIQALYCATAYGGVGTGHKVMDLLGATSIPVVNVEAGCASGAAALSLAVAGIQAGAHDRVAVLGVEKMPKGMIRSSYFEPWQERAGLTVTPAYFALRAQRLMREEGLNKRHLATVVEKNRALGAANPNAMFRKAVTADEVLASPIVCEPLHLWMLCSPNEGAACVVLQREPPSQHPRVRLLAVALRSHFFGNVLGEHSPLCGLVDNTPPSPTEAAAHEAYEAAGVGPEDIHVVECQDTDAAREILAYRELGLCRPGDCARALHERWFYAGGSKPVNLSGGLLSKGEPLGASAVGQVVDLVWRLRDETFSPRGTKHALALAHTVGRGANAAVTILARA